MTTAIQAQTDFIDLIVPRINEMRPHDLFISINVSGIKLDGDMIRENFHDARAKVSSRFTDFNLFEGRFISLDLFQAVFERYNEYLNRDKCNYRSGGIKNVWLVKKENCHNAGHAADALKYLRHGLD